MSAITIYNKLGNADEVANSLAGQNGTWSGTAAYSAVKFGNGAYSNNAGDYISFPEGNFNPNKFTIEFWFKSDWNCVNGGGGGANQHYFTWYINANNRILFYELNGHWINHIIGGASDAQRFNPASMDWTAGDIIHLALVYQRSGINGTSDTKRLYFNNSLVGSTTSIPANQSLSGGTLYILNEGGAAANPINGAVDNFKIYTYAKTNFADRNDERAGLGDITVIA